MLDEFGKETFDNLEEEIEAAMGDAFDPDFTLGDAARRYQDLTDTLRAHALLWLLVEADPQTCFRDLTMSGQARRHFLRRCQKEKQTFSITGCSHLEPFVDAVAAESWDVARDIATVSPADWLKNQEYEDDFCYGRFLHLWVLRKPDAPPDELQKVLDRFDRALGKADGSRLAVCRALLAHDEGAFRDAFDALLAQRQDEVKAKLARTTHNPALLLDCQVFVEGLALLRLADALGFRMESEYPGCPRLARVPSQVGVLPDSLPPP